MKCKIVIGIMCILVFVGCKTEYRTIERIRTACTLSSNQLRATFILSCLKNANPQSDEEPEDWMPICSEMAQQVYCPSITVVIKQEKRGSYWETISETPKNKQSNKDNK